MTCCSTSKAIYVFGGIKIGDQIRKSVEKLEINSNGDTTEGWKKLPPMRKRRTNSAAAVLGDRYIIIMYFGNDFKIRGKIL